MKSHAILLTAVGLAFAAHGGTVVSGLGADAAAKAAEVTLLDVHLGTGIGGKSFVVMTGEVATVREAVAAGTKSARKEGLLIQEVVIPNPRPEIIDALL